jgi:hypothetical protein
MYSKISTFTVPVIRADEQSGNRNVTNTTQGGFNLDSSPSSKPTDDSFVIDSSVSKNTSKSGIGKLNNNKLRSKLMSQSKQNQLVNTQQFNQLVTSHYYGETQYGTFENNTLRTKSPSGATEALKQRIQAQ